MIAPEPPAGATVILHFGHTGAKATAPHDRWVMRRAASIDGAVLAACEPTLADPGAGLALGPRWREWLAANRARIGRVVATAIVEDLDVDELWLSDLASQAYAAVPEGTAEADRAGRDTVLAALDARERRALGRAGRVVTANTALAAVIGAELDTSAPALAPFGTRPRSREVVFLADFGFDLSAEHVARAWHASTDLEEGYVAVLGSLRAAAHRYALATAFDATCFGVEAWRRACDAAACVIAPGQSALGDELRAAGAHVVLAGEAITWAAGPAPAAREGEADIGSPGTLAAYSLGDDAFSRELAGSVQLPWVQALIANKGLGAQEAYELWRCVHHDNPERHALLRRRAERLTYRPLISIVTPVYNTDTAVLEATVESVLAQHYSHWELLLVDDGSARDETTALLSSLGSLDPRIVIQRRESSGGIVTTTNDGIGRARGAYVALLDHDDLLAPDALYWVVRRLELDPSLDIVYTDEDKLDEAGRRVEPFFKPDWSPDYLLSVNYITHLLVVRRTLLERAGLLRAGFDGAQDYDLILRLTELTDRIAHLAAPLYTWRKVAGSTAADIQNKPAAHSASERALDEALARRGVGARRERGLQPTWHRVRYQVSGNPSCSVIVPTRDRVDLLRPCVDALRNTIYRPFELVVVDNESREPETLAYLGELRAQNGVQVVRYPHRFNFARQMNLAAANATGDVLLFFNNDARPRSVGWFDAMLEHAMRAEVGAVGARLLWPDGRAQHEGVVLNAGGVALNLDSGPYLVYGSSIRNMAAVTAACLMTRASVFRQIGGMDERLRVAYNDVDLCLRLGLAGWRVIYTPYAELTHAESSTRGSLHPEVDEEFYQTRWGAPYHMHDPFYSPNLELMQPWSPRL